MQIQKLTLLISSMLPDLIDKPIALLFNESGREFGHSPFLMLIFLIFIHMIFRNKKIDLAFLIGFMGHLILDIPYIPWFYPFIEYNFDFGSELLDGWFYALFHDPKVMITELIGITFFLAIILKFKLYRFRNIKDFLLKSVS